MLKIQFLKFMTVYINLSYNVLDKCLITKKDSIKNIKTYLKHFF